MHIIESALGRSWAQRAGSFPSTICSEIVVKSREEIKMVKQLIATKQFDDYCRNFGREFVPLVFYRSLGLSATPTCITHPQKPIFPLGNRSYTNTREKEFMWFPIEITRNDERARISLGIVMVHVIKSTVSIHICICVESYSDSLAPSFTSLMSIYARVHTSKCFVSGLPEHLLSMIFTISPPFSLSQSICQRQLQLSLLTATEICKYVNICIRFTDSFFVFFLHVTKFSMNDFARNSFYSFEKIRRAWKKKFIR